MLGGGRRKPVKIVVVGDEKVGKTSLVVAASNESFPDACPPVVPPAILPAECTPEGVPLHIIDTSSRAEERTALEQTCLTADVLVLLFDTARLQSLKRIGSYWLPELRRLGVHVPVILVGSKIDISKQQDIAALARPVTKKFREIESCLECSAKRLINVVDVFYFALKSVIYPVAPVFDPHVEDGLGALKPLCIRALKRIFLMNDHDRDGALNDAELNHFQVNCFSAPLQPEELAGIRRVVSEQMPQGINGAGLTLPGFLFLHALFIERGRLETVWTVLRKYGYDDSLSLSQEVLSEVNLSHGPDQVVEMTEACRNFFSQKFMEYDKDGNKLLSYAEQGEMFSVAPTGPWRGEEFKGLTVETGRDGQDGTSLTLQGFLAKWAYTTAVEPVRTLAYIRYLGFAGPAGLMFSISKSRRQERKAEQLQRSVVQASVFLASSSGSGAFSSGLIGKSVAPSTSSAPSEEPLRSLAVGEVKAPAASTSSVCTLILRELGNLTPELLEKEPRALATADVAAFVFDAQDFSSFQQAHQALQLAAQECRDILPCLLVSIEGKKGMSQEVMAECGSVCGELELRQPISVDLSVPDDIPAALQTFLLAAAQPEKSLAIPQTPALKATKRYHRMLRTVALYSVGGMAGGLLCYAVYKAYNNRAASSPLSSETQVSSSSARLADLEVPFRSNPQ